VSYHDPYVARWQRHEHGGPVLEGVADVYEAVAAADIAVLLQPHRAYDLGRLAASAGLLLDTRGVIYSSATV